MPVADAVWGYNQVSALLMATAADPTAFHALPAVCGPLRLQASKLDFVYSGRAGILRSLDQQGLESIRRLPSFLRFDLLPRPGDSLSPTIDCFTAVGSVSLLHALQTQLDEDVEAVRRIEKSLFIMEEEEEGTQGNCQAPLCS